jgi:intracellular multiplication protein IcmO
MSFDVKRYDVSQKSLLRDTRPLLRRIGDTVQESNASISIFIGALLIINLDQLGMMIPNFQANLIGWADLIFIPVALFFWWLTKRDKSLPFKLPVGAPWPDKRNEGPGLSGKAEGIMYLGNDKKSNEEVWMTSNDIKTHIMYLGTTGSGKTQGLMSIASNSLSWGSGFVYIDGKADTNLWSALSAMVRRFGRDDDLFVINYMTGNSDNKAPSNTLNPFSSGSASYLTQMLVSLLPDASGDNVMWKERAVSMVSAIMPVLTWKRDHQDVPMSVSSIRSYMILNNIIKLSRDDQVPIDLRNAVVGYLDTLPGFVGAAFDDNGQVKPPGPDTPNVDTTTAFTQHGYLSMQLTRALQSLGDDYGYIFDALAADVDMLDVVINRRILVVLIPALEKSADETANLGKIVAATLKGMMGATLGATVEGESSTVIDNKPVNSATPFVTIFDEVGYYTTQGMAVMAAQARSLGFSLVFAAQDLPAMEKRVKEEARSIVANCNIKIFGKLEDPTATRELFEKTITSSFVTEVSSFNTQLDSMTKNYYDSASASVQTRSHVSYEELRGFKQGEAVICSGDKSVIAKMYYSNPGDAKAMRVTRFMPLPPPTETMLRHVGDITRLRDLLVKKGWTAAKADVASPTPEELTGSLEAFKRGLNAFDTATEAAMVAIAGAYAAVNPVNLDEVSAPPAAAAPIAPPIDTAAPTSPPPLTPPSAPAAAGGSPFSGFAKGGTTTTPTTDNTSMPVTSRVDTPSQAATMPATTATPDQTSPLDAETVRILHAAADEVRDQLVKEKEDA